MKMKFVGSYEALQDIVLQTGPDGGWDDLGNLKQFRAVSGAVLNWWGSTGTIQFQGKAAAAADFQKAFQIGERKLSKPQR
ncbi:MAG: hypothetical protein ACREHF_13670 [Rhizomicrobium sp.]